MEVSSASVPETTSNLATKSRQVSTQNRQKTIFMSDLLNVTVDCVVPKEEYDVFVDNDVKDEVVTDVVEAVSAVDVSVAPVDVGPGAVVVTSVAVD